MDRVQVERLREQYTDKYVVVESRRPELVRFQGVVGQVKTVNMNGRALVQFDANNDRGWYDLAVEDLKVVEKPPPKPTETKGATPKPKPAGVTAPEQAPGGSHPA